VADHEAAPKPIFNNRAYDAMKFIAQIALPALGTLYFAIAGIWGLPYGEQIVGTITAIDVFLGAVLMVSASNYRKSDARYDGTFITDGTFAPVLDVQTAPQDMVNKKELTFKVEQPPA
jgi:hypothetical protein